MEQIDTVTLSVIHNGLTNICREMGTAMMRTSYSPIFNEGLDFSCVIFNTRAEMIGQAEFCPTMLGSAQYAVKWTIDELGLESFAPGDVVIHNDPYRGQCHMPEHMVLKPVFFEDELWGFVANIAHIGEIGGMAPGSFAADATEVYQEGLRLPPVKIMSRGEHVRDIWKIVLSNHRTPKTSWGDLHAMIGSLSIAENRVLELLERYGAPFLTAAADQLLDYSERWMRAEIQEIPNGIYSASDCMEDDGVTDQPVWIRLKLVVRDDDVIADWTDSDPQAKGPVNATFVVTAAASYSGLLHVTNKDIPRNSGCYRPIRLITHPGSVVNVRHPGPSWEEIPRPTPTSRTSWWPRLVRRFPRGRRQLRELVRATFSSAASTPERASTTLTITSRAAVGVALRTTTETTSCVPRMGTVEIRRWKSWRQSFQCERWNIGSAPTLEERASIVVVLEVPGLCRSWLRR